MSKIKNPIDKHIRVAIEFDKELQEIKLARLKNGLDKIDRVKSDRRITLAIKRHKNFEEIKEDIIKAELPEDLLE